MTTFKKIIYQITRIYAKNYLTNNLGKVVEDDEKITCYVKKSKIKNKNQERNIICSGIGEIKEKKKIAKAYKLDKPICYVIDGLESSQEHNIYGSNDCEVIVKNCKFERGLSIYVIGKCTLDNTNIKIITYSSIGANELVIKNISSDQMEFIGYESTIRISSNNKTDIINSNIGSKNMDSKVMIISANELNITNSSIIGKEVQCKSNIINADEKSSLTATDKVALKTNNFNPININAPIIELNEKEITNKKEKVTLEQITDSLSLKRLELVNILKRVKKQCESINSRKTSEYKEKINNDTISNVLKRKIN